MNNRTARKLHRMVGALASRQMKNYQALPLWYRLQIAWRVVFKV